MSKQKILIATENYEEMDQYMTENAIKNILLVCDPSISFLRIDQYFNELEKRVGVKVIKFQEFQPNPLYESAVKGVEMFHAQQCDSIVAVGGGSAIDVAKCIKLYSNMDPKENYLRQAIIPNQIKLLAVPTTAGTGSEATRYAVVYYKGEKQSITDDSCIPSAVLMDSSVLKTLPEYQKKATMMDAFSHAIESFWSVNSTEESKAYSREAIQSILANMNSYLENQETGNAAMLKAAHTAGEAINITQTTAGHAMCYKLTGLYGIAHGHAAALCVAQLFPFMIERLDRCIDVRGKEYLAEVFQQIAKAMGCVTSNEAAEKFKCILKELGFSIPQPKEEDYEVLKKSVNLVRLKNNPVNLSEEEIGLLYHRILDK